MIYLIIAEAIGTTICFAILAYDFIQKKKAKKKAIDFDEYEKVNEQISNYLYDIIGMTGANRVLLYKLMNGRVFLTKEGEYKLVLTHEKLDDYLHTQSFIRSHKPQQVSTYGLTYIELRHNSKFSLHYSESISKEDYQKHFHFFSEMQERNVTNAYLFHMKSFNDSTPFGIVSIEFENGNSAHKNIDSMMYDIELIIKKINLLLERITEKDNGN